MKALFDTNILIDYFNGEQKAKKEIELYDIHAISIITYIEIIVGLQNVEESKVIKNFLHHFSTIGVDLPVAERTALLRKKYKLKIPDAIILATAEHHQYLLLLFRIFLKIFLKFWRHCLRSCRGNKSKYTK